MCNIYKVVDTMGVKKFQNNDVITLGLKIDEDSILRCHGRSKNQDSRNQGTYLLTYKKLLDWTTFKTISNLQFVMIQHEVIFNEII